MMSYSILFMMKLITHFCRLNTIGVWEGRAMMSDLPSTNTSQPAVLAEIILVPSENEEDDFETLSAVEEVMAAVLSDNSRSTGVILLLGQIAHQVIAQKDLMIA